MSKKSFLVLLILLIFVINVNSQTRKEVKYKLAGRNMIEDKNLFFELGVKGTDYYCRSESIANTQNPVWTQTECSVIFSGDPSQVLRIEIRNDISGGIDEGIGWGFIYVKNMLEQGKTIKESIWRENGNSYRGYIRINVERVLLLRQINDTSYTSF